MTYIPGWAPEPNYPAGASAWSGTATKVNPNYDIFTPGQAPTAQEMNRLFNAAVPGLAPGAAVNNFGPLHATAGAKALVAATIDDVLNIALAIGSNGTDSEISYSWDGGLATWNTYNVVAGHVLGCVCVKPGALAFSLTLDGTFQVWELLTTSHTTTAGAFGNTPTACVTAQWFDAAAMFVGIGVQNSGPTALTTAFSSTDGITQTDRNSALPSAWISSTNHVDHIFSAKNSNTLLVGEGASTIGQHSRLMSITWNGSALVMTDVTPVTASFYTKVLIGVAWNAALGVWGALVTDGSGVSYLWTSPDLSTWTVTNTVLENGGNVAMSVGLQALGNTFVSTGIWTLFNNPLYRLCAYNPANATWRWLRSTYTTNTPYVGLGGAVNDVVAFTASQLQLSQRVGNIVAT